MSEYGLAKTSPKEMHNCFCCKTLLIVMVFIIGIVLICIMIDSFNSEKFDTINSDNEKNLSNVYNTNDYRLDDNVEGDIILESIDTDKRDYIDEGRMEGIVAHSLKCSRACCGTNWPVPDELIQYDDVNGKGFVRTNLTCANGLGGSGCVCIPRSVRKLYERRGQKHDTGFI